MKSTDQSSRRKFLATAATGAAISATLSPGLGTTNAFAQSSHNYGILGATAPELKVDYWIDSEGKDANFSVKDAAGKWVFLKCFQNWCPGCHSSGFPTLQAFSKAFYGHPKVAIAGIQTVFEGFSSNSQKAVRELQLRYELPIVMGHNPGDPDGNHRPTTMIDYRTGGTPWLILINPEGTVVFNDFHVNTEKLIEYVGEQIA